MIIIKLKGGLGNQLFQYAYGKALSLRTHQPLKLDIFGYSQKSSDTPRDYLLSLFNITSGECASREEIENIKYPFGLISKCERVIRQKVFKNFNIGYSRSMLKATGNVYRDGFWQSELYFKDVENEIRRELTLKEPFSPEAQHVADHIRDTQNQKRLPAVSLHVRRGDVARDAKTNPYYGICTPEYYARALKEMNMRVGTFRVFVFSDDVEWVKKNIDIPYPTTYISDEIPDYEQLILMSTCDHNIIANSSFSWWGAWLNRNQNKIIIAPKSWIKRHTSWHKDTVPPSWIRV